MLNYTTRFQIGQPVIFKGKVQFIGGITTVEHINYKNKSYIVDRYHIYTKDGMYLCSPFQKELSPVPTNKPDESDILTIGNEYRRIGFDSYIASIKINNSYYALYQYCSDIYDAVPPQNTESKRCSELDELLNILMNLKKK